MKGRLRRTATFGLLLLSLSVAGSYLRLGWRSLDLDIYFDSYGYLLVARALRHGEFVLEFGTLRQTPFHPPGYPVAILAAAGFGEPGVEHPALTSAVMGTLAAPLAGLAGAALFGMPAGLAAAAFWALNPLHVAYSQIAMADSTALSLSLGGAVLWLRGGGRISAVFAGSAFAAAFLTRYAEGLSFVWLVLLAPRSLARRSADRRVNRKLWGLVGLALSLAPFALWQLTHFGLIRTTYGPLGDTFALRRAFEPPNNTWMYAPELGHLPAYLYFLATGDGRPFVPLCHSPLLLLLGLVTLVLAGHRERILALWLLSWVAAHVLLYSTVWASEPRYMLPAYVPLAWLASAGLAQVGRRSRVLAALLLVILVAPPVWLSRGSMLVHRSPPDLRRLPEVIAHCPRGARIVTMSAMAIQVYDPERASRVIEPQRVAPSELVRAGAGPSCIVVDAVMNQYGRPWLEQVCGAGTCREAMKLPGLELRVVNEG